MHSLTFYEISRHMFRLYRQGRYHEAYRYISMYSGQFKENEAQMLNWRMCLANLSGMPKTALQLFKKAVNKGYWYAPEELREDSDLKSLNGNGEFEGLVEICRVRQNAAQKNSKPFLYVVEPEGLGMNAKKPVIIALHGNSQNGSVTCNEWGSVAQDGWVLAAPQSSQVSSSNAFNWLDAGKGLDEVRRHFSSLGERSDIDKDNVIIGGFSAGGRLALWTVLNGAIPVKGFILMGPWLPELDEWKALMSKMAAGKGLKGYIIAGDKDELCLEQSREAARLLNECSTPCGFESVSGLEHNYRPDFGAYLKRAVGFIMS